VCCGLVSWQQLLWILQKARFQRPIKINATTGPILRRFSKHAPPLRHKVVNDIPHRCRHERERHTARHAHRFGQPRQRFGHAQDRVRFKVRRRGGSDKDNAAEIVVAFPVLEEQRLARLALQRTKAKDFAVVQVETQVHTGAAEIADAVKEENGGCVILKGRGSDGGEVPIDIVRVRRRCGSSHWWL
jgi:hypothetical protein